MGNKALAVWFLLLVGLAPSVLPQHLPGDIGSPWEFETNISVATDYTNSQIQVAVATVGSTVVGDWRVDRTQSDLKFIPSGSRFVGTFIRLPQCPHVSTATPEIDVMERSGEFIGTERLFDGCRLANVGANVNIVVGEGGKTARFIVTPIDGIECPDCGAHVLTRLNDNVSGSFSTLGIVFLALFLTIVLVMILVGIWFPELLLAALDGAGAALLRLSPRVRPRPILTKLRQTIHGAERAADPSRLGPAAQAEVIANATQRFTQADGARVFVQEVDGRYNVVIQGDSGNIVTNLKTISRSSFDRLASRYGWHSN